MRKIYLSFLGLGQYDKERQTYRYRRTIYELNGNCSDSTRFVQVAEQMLLGWEYFDILYIAATRASADAHLEQLQQQLSPCRGEVVPIILDENMSGAGQWKWFEAISDKIIDEDELTVDLTHGYRSIPIIFSTAINFLQKTKKIHLSHVFYGAYEQDRESAPLIDMRHFFDINIWADAVTRLTVDADARGIAEAAETTNKHQFAELSSNSTFVDACVKVTRKIKSVDVNNIADEIVNLMDQIKQLKKESSPGGVMLLDLVRAKYLALVDPPISNPDKTSYTLEYFESQLKLVNLLLDHGLYMQAFTVMREWLSSLVMLYFEKQKDMNAGKRRKRISRYGSIFFDMLQFAQEAWNFKGREQQLKRLQPFYDELKQAGILEPLINIIPLPAKELSDYRNGFDHAWLGKTGMKEDLEQKGRYFLKQLQDVYQRLRQGKYLDPFSGTPQGGTVQTKNTFIL